MSSQAKLTELFINLHSIGALKFGDFKMKVGLNSPVYFDLRVIVSYPKLMAQLSSIFLEFMRSKEIVCDHLCGVPYTALPIATLMAVESDMPMVMRRKEAKSYGTKKMIEGKFSVGDSVLIVEDVVTSGSSILETYTDLKNSELNVTDSIVVIDREQGGVQNLMNHGIKLHSVITLSQVMDILLKAGKIDTGTVKTVKDYLAVNQIPLPSNIVGDNRLQMPFSARAQLSKCSMSKNIFKVIEEKKSTLCLAADVTSSKCLLSLARDVGDYIAVFKTHIDIIEDLSIETLTELKKIAQEKNFLLMEDRKLADIGNTVKYQFTRQCAWADLVTVHALTGTCVFDAIKQAMALNGTEQKGVFVVAELSSKDNLITPAYTKEVINMAASHDDIVAGLVCQSPEVISSPGLVQLTPGVSTHASSDNLGQQYCSPEEAVCSKGADLVVVGRAITQPTTIDGIGNGVSKTPSQVAREIRGILWDCYEKRLKGGD